MELLEEFYQDNFVYNSFAFDLENQPDLNEFERDVSGYVYVDGEEGDYGVIKYTEKSTGKHVASRVIKGGDNEHYEFTAYGTALFADRLLKIMAERLEEVKKKAQLAEGNG
jgi:hypothetical protein